MQTSDLVAILALIVSIVSIILSIFYAYRELSLSTKISKGEFLLHLDELFQEHKTVHLYLRPGGKWSGTEGPESAEEWARVEAYMGLFERIKVLIDDKIIDLKTFNRLHGYRLQNIVQNE